MAQEEQEQAEPPPFTTRPSRKIEPSWKEFLERGFVFDDKDTQILRGLSLTMIIRGLSLIIAVLGLLYPFFGALLSWLLFGDGTPFVSLVALGFLALTFEKFSARWAKWVFGTLAGGAFLFGELNGAFLFRLQQNVGYALLGVGYVIAPFVGLALFARFRAHRGAWWALGISVAAFLVLGAILDCRCVTAVFAGIALLMSVRGRSGAWWSSVLRRLDAAEKRQRNQMGGAGGSELPKDARFLRFFSRFCLVAMGVVFVVALIVFFVPIERSYGWYERRYVTVTIFDSIKSVLSIFGQGDGLELRYWIAVAVNCLTLFAWSVYAKSVTNAAASHSQILAVTNRKAGASLGKLGVCASVWRVAGVIMGLISIVAAIKSFNLDLTTSVAIALCLCSLILGGTLAVFCWGLESIFAMQAWNEAAAQAIAGWVVMKSNATSEETISTRSTHVTANQRDEHLAHVATYRELAIGAGAEQACPELFSKADETVQKAKELAETENVDAFVFSETCAEAVTAYRMAIQQGAEAAAKWLEKTAYEALMEGHLDDALAAAEGALDWNPHSKMAAQIRFHVTMKKDSKILIAVLVGWAIVFFMCRGISAMAR